jgi:hypothetical protein
MLTQVFTCCTNLGATLQEGECGVRFGFREVHSAQPARQISYNYLGALTHTSYTYDPYYGVHTVHWYM